MTPTLPTTDLLAGRYRLERLIGRGGMADVYRAADQCGGEPVAVKLVRSTDPELARRLTQEASALERLDHPGLVRLLDAGIHDDQPFLVMELVEGPTLSTRLHKGPLPPDRCATLGSTLADSLSYVHEQGIVHRDVKPGNVLLGPHARVRLADFGIAQLVDASSLTLTGTTLGTASYMAPEQLEHHRVGPAADVWSLGAILLECMTGRRGFDGTATEVFARRIAGTAPAIDENLPAPWRMLLSSMLDHEPGSRPDPAQVAEMLVSPAYARPWDPNPTKSMRAGADESATTTALATRTLIRDHVPVRRRRRPPLAVSIAVAGVLVALVALLAWAFGAAHTAAPKPLARNTTTSTTTTSTTTPSAGAAAAALVSDVQQGEASGSLSAATGSAILNELGQLIAAASQGDSTKASRSLGAIDATIASAAAGGTASPGEVSTLTADVAALQSALGTAAQAPTTTVAPTHGGAPPKHDH